MKKFTTLILAATISIVTMIASGNAFATNNGPGMHDDNHRHSMNNKEQKKAERKAKKKAERKAERRAERRAGKNQKDVPAPIPGLLAIAAAAGGGAMLRRKAKKAQAEK